MRLNDNVSYAHLYLIWAFGILIYYVGTAEREHRKKKHYFPNKGSVASVQFKLLRILSIRK